jgi:hypothetical protein
MTFCVTPCEGIQPETCKGNDIFCRSDLVVPSAGAMVSPQEQQISTAVASLRGP